MALTARILSTNGRDNIECYAAGVNGNLPVGVIPCEPIGRAIGLHWAIPCSTNGITVTSFDYVMAVPGVSVKPRIDAVKVITIENVSNGGSYQRAIVPDTYEIGDYITACCTGCLPIPSVTVVEPLIFNGDCVLPAPTLNPCVYNGSFFVPALTGANTTYTLTARGFDANGVEVVFSPATVTGTTAALLASAAQTAWATEMGTGTFVATGNLITWTATIVKSLGVSITQA